MKSLQEFQKIWRKCNIPDPVTRTFSDLHGLGTSFGSIDNLNGLKVIVQNLPEPKGFLIIASGGPGAAELTVCSNYLSISDGDEVEITC